jgi:hypothetical protein
MNQGTGLPPLPLEYDNPGTAPRRRGLPPFSLPAFFTTGAIVLLSGWIIEIVIPRMEILYHDYGIPIPVATQILLDVAVFCSHPAFVPAIILPVLVALLVPHIVPRIRADDSGTTIRGRRLMVWAVVLFLVNLVALAVFIVVGITLWLPMMNLMSNLAAQNAGK